MGGGQPPSYGLLEHQRLPVSETYTTLLEYSNPTEEFYRLDVQRIKLSCVFWRLLSWPASENTPSLYCVQPGSSLHAGPKTGMGSHPDQRDWPGCEVRSVLQRASYGAVTAQDPSMLLSASSVRGKDHPYAWGAGGVAGGASFSIA